MSTESWRAAGQVCTGGLAVGGWYLLRDTGMLWLLPALFTPVMMGVLKEAANRLSFFLLVKGGLAGMATEVMRADGTAEWYIGFPLAFAAIEAIDGAGALLFKALGVGVNRLMQALSRS